MPHWRLDLSIRKHDSPSHRLGCTWEVQNAPGTLCLEFIRWPLRKSFDNVVFESSSMMYPIWSTSSNYFVFRVFWNRSTGSWAEILLVLQIVYYILGNNSTAPPELQWRPRPLSMTTSSGYSLGPYNNCLSSCIFVPLEMMSFFPRIL